MRKEILNIIFVLILFVVVCNFIAWDKEAIKACITGGVFGAWIVILVRRHLTR